MHHLIHCLSLDTPKTQQIRHLELNLECFYTKVFPMNIDTCNIHGELWKDFIIIKWIYDYLQKTIYIWFNERGKLFTNMDMNLN
jgi:hypothetical protein